MGTENNLSAMRNKKSNRDLSEKVAASLNQTLGRRMTIRERNPMLNQFIKPVDQNKRTIVLSNSPNKDFES